MENMGSRALAMLRAGFLLACVVLLAAGFLITLIEAVIVQLMDSEIEAMVLYIVSVAALIAAFGTWKHAKRKMDFAAEW
jgi:hypothetical protein